MGIACTYCGLDVYDHDPVFVETEGSDGREPAGKFCNYACLEAYIEENDLTEGACCRLDV